MHCFKSAVICTISFLGTNLRSRLILDRYFLLGRRIVTRNDGKLVEWEETRGRRIVRVQPDSEERALSVAVAGSRRRRVRIVTAVIKVGMTKTSPARGAPRRADRMRPHAALNISRRNRQRLL